MFFCGYFRRTIPLVPEGLRSQKSNRCDETSILSSFLKKLRLIDIKHLSALLRDPNEDIESIR